VCSKFGGTERWFVGRYNRNFINESTGLLANHYIELLLVATRLRHAGSHPGLVGASQGLDLESGMVSDSRRSSPRAWGGSRVAAGPGAFRKPSAPLQFRSVPRLTTTMMSCRDRGHRANSNQR